MDSKSDKDDRVNILEVKYNGIRNENFFSHCPWTICNPRQPGWEGVLLQFDLQLLIRPCDGKKDPGYITIKSVSLREWNGQKRLGLPGKKTSSGAWFTMVEMHTSLEDEIIEEALKLTRN